MPQTKMLTADGREAGSVDLAETLFAAPINEGLIHQAVVRQLAGRRVGTSDTLTRGEVHGGGKKPWRQKGTGRARQGTKTAPHWTGGGVVFGPHPRSFEQRMPAKMRRSAETSSGRRATVSTSGSVSLPSRRSASSVLPVASPE